MTQRNWIVVPAAGASRRLAAALPKQYLEVGGRTLLEHALAALLARPDIDGGVVVLDPGDERWSRLPAGLRNRLATTAGGPARCHSVLAGLEALSAADDDWVLVHDAARPCLAAAELGRLIDSCRADAVGGLLALPVADTLKRSDAAGRVERTVERESLWRAQTPQMFRYAPLKRALAAAIADGETPGDEATAMELSGFRPLLVEGSPFNIKVTYPADLGFVAAVLAARGEEGR